MLCLHYRDIIPIPTANIYYWFILVVYLRNSLLATLGDGEFIVPKIESVSKTPDDFSSN